MTHADEPQDLWVTGPKFTKFVAVAICFVDGANTTIRIAIRPSIVEWRATFKTNKPTSGIAMPDGLIRRLLLMLLLLLLSIINKLLWTITT